MSKKEIDFHDGDGGDEEEDIPFLMPTFKHQWGTNTKEEIRIFYLYDPKKKQVLFTDRTLRTSDGIYMCGSVDGINNFIDYVAALEIPTILFRL